MIIFSDPHLHKFNSVYGNNALDIGLEALKQIRTYAVENGGLNIVCAGDLWHLKDRIPIIVLNRLFDELLVWEEYGINSYWLLGNHDKNVDITINILKVFKHANPIILPSIIGIENKTCNFLPYGYKYDHKFFTKENRDILFVHDFFKGYDYHFDAGGLNKKIIDDYNCVFAGHYHYHRAIIEKKAWHIGSTHQTNFSEVDEEKYFIVLNEEIEFIKINCPELIQFNYDEKEKYDVKGKYIKVIVEVKSLSNYNVKNIKQEFTESGALGIKIETRYIQSNKKRIKDGGDMITLSDNEIIDDFIKQKTSEEDGLDKELLFSLSQKIIEKESEN